MAIIFIRSIIIFIVLLIVMRLMGKRQIGEMQPFEFIITLLIAELACAPMADVSLPLAYGIVSVIAVFIIHQTINVVEQLSQTAKKITSGKPSIVINKNGIDVKELKSNQLDVEDLIEAIRSAGYFSFSQIEYAIFESNGNFSVLPKQSAEEYNSLPILIVNEGKIIKKNLYKIEQDENYIFEIMKNNGIEKLKNIDVLTIDGNGSCYLQAKNKKYTKFNIKLKEGIAW